MHIISWHHLDTTCLLSIAASWKGSLTALQTAICYGRVSCQLSSTDKCTCLQQSLSAADPVPDILGELLMTVAIAYGCVANSDRNSNS